MVEPTDRMSKAEAGLRAVNGILSAFIPTLGLGITLVDQLMEMRRERGQPVEDLETARAKYQAALSEAHAASDEFHRLFPTE